MQRKHPTSASKKITYTAARNSVSANPMLTFILKNQNLTAGGGAGGRGGEVAASCSEINFRNKENNLHTTDEKLFGGKIFATIPKARRVDDLTKKNAWDLIS